jgi:hypothetical protein
MTKKLIILIATLVLTISLLPTVACAKPEFREVSLEEATGMLDKTAFYTREHDIENLHKQGTSEAVLRTYLDQVDGIESAPSATPTIIDSYLIPDKKIGNSSYAIGGRILVIEGTDNFGRDYHSEFLVSWSPFEKKLFVQNPVYWANLKAPSMNMNSEGKIIVPPSNED